jgi:DNA-binding transcriptional MerR regulator
MDTTEVAEALGTSPRMLRQFLRSDYSTFQAVGSGARYDFTKKDMSTLEKRFADWRKDGKPRPDAEKRAKAPAATKPTKAAKQDLRDKQEWAEEGTVVLEDIRNPRVRARVLADARAAEDRLMTRLAAAGLHVYQLGDRKAS